MLITKAMGYLINIYVKKSERSINEYDNFNSYFIKHQPGLFNDINQT